MTEAVDSDPGGEIKEASLISRRKPGAFSLFEFQVGSCICGIQRRLRHFPYPCPKTKVS